MIKAYAYLVVIPEEIHDAVMADIGQHPSVTMQRRPREDVVAEPVPMEGVCGRCGRLTAFVLAPQQRCHPNAPILPVTSPLFQRDAHGY